MTMKIYKITNKINNKLYVGQTVRTLKSRLERHFNDAKKGSDLKFHKAIRKYGEDNFIIEEIDEAKSKEELNKKEIYWIGKLDTYKNGYNSSLGGEGGNTYLNKTDSEMKIIKEKISKSNSGKNNGMAKKVKCYSIKEQKEYVFDTAKQCRDFFNVKNKSFITDRCNNKIKNLYKNEWKIAWADKNYYDFKPYDKTFLNGLAKKTTVVIDDKEYTFDSINKAQEFKKSFKCVSTIRDECSGVGSETSTESKQKTIER